MCVFGFKKYLWIDYNFFFCIPAPPHYQKTTRLLDVTVRVSVWMCLVIWGQLLSCGCSRFLCSTVAGPTDGGVVLVLLPVALIQGRESSDAPVVVVAVIVNWIIWSRWMRRIKVLRRSREACVSRCWLRRHSFSSMHFCWAHTHTHGLTLLCYISVANHQLGLTGVRL